MFPGLRQPQIGGPVYRIRQGDWLAYTFWECIVTGQANAGGFTIASRARAIYDDGTEELFDFPNGLTDSVASGSTIGDTIVSSRPAKTNGYVFEWTWQVLNGPIPKNSIWVSGNITADQAAGFSLQTVARGPLSTLGFPTLGVFVPDSPDYWPTWVFQGTVVSDATVGTHSATLVVTPGAGSAIEVLYGAIIAAGAAAVAVQASIDDGTNNLVQLVNQATAGGWYFPAANGPTVNIGAAAGARYVASGTMRLKLLVNTSTVSQTQTFSVVCRIHPTFVPTAVLADNVGAPALTTNTNAVV